MRSHLREIELQRRLKIERGVESIDGQYLQANNLGLDEIENNRSFLTQTFDIVRDLN